MENEEVGKMLANIYGKFAGVQDGGVKRFKNGLFNFYVNLDSVYDRGNVESAILHFVEFACKAKCFSKDYAEEFLEEFYQLAYYKGEALKLVEYIDIQDSWLNDLSLSAFKRAQEDIDDCVKDIIVLENSRKEYLRKCFSSEEFKKYEEIIHNFSKDEDDSLHLPELQKFLENFEELKRNVKMYDKSIDETKTELYNMMTNSNCERVGSIGDFGSFLEKEIARVSSEEKTKTNPDGDGK